MRTLLRAAIAFSLAGLAGFGCSPAEGKGGSQGGQAAASTAPALPAKPPAEPGAPPPPPPPAKLGLPAPLAMAIDQAAKEDKLVVVDFFDETCNFCVEMEEELEKEAVQKALQGFIYVKLGTKEPLERALVRQFNLAWTPTFLFYTKEGKPLDDLLEGFRPAAVFLAELENARRAWRGLEPGEVPETDHESFGKG